MAYTLRIARRKKDARDGGALEVELLGREHQRLVSLINRGAGRIRLLRRIVDVRKTARFRADEVEDALQEIEELREGLGVRLMSLEGDELQGIGARARTLLTPYLDRLEELFAEARDADVGVIGEETEEAALR